MFLMYALRRVACSACGVRVEAMAWVSGKSRLTQAYAWFLARWAQRLSWKEAAQTLVTPLCGVTPFAASRCELTHTKRPRPVGS